MTFKSSAQLFGDGGAHGAQVPINLTNPPGTAAANRGVQFGEQVTAAIANRIAYALGLNTDDLNTRIADFETTGLDAAYRLGAVNVAGGGRVVTLNGGAIETRSTLATLLATDKANAHFRADATGDSIDGSGGFDFCGFVGASVATPRFGYMDRRSYAWNSARTVVSTSQAATLNAAAVGGDTVTLGSGQWKDGSGNTDLLLSYDIVEILSGTFRGLYLLNTLATQTRATLRHLSGETPVFTASTAVTLRVYRPILSTATGYSVNGGTQSFMQGGTTLSSLPSGSTSDGSLRLIPAGRGGLDSDGTDGARYALRVLQADAAGALSVVTTIDGAGSVRSAASVMSVGAARRSAGSAFGNPAFYAAQATANTTYEVGMVAQAQIGTLANFYGLAGLEAVDTTTAFTFPTSGTGSGTGFDSGTGQTVLYGQIIEIVTPTAQAGFYNARSVATDRVVLEYLDGTAVSGFPTDGSAGTFRYHGGGVLGRRRIAAPTPLTVNGSALSANIDASLTVHGPHRNTGTTSDTAIYASVLNAAGNAFLRCFSGAQERAVLTSSGIFGCARVEAPSIEAVTSVTTADVQTDSMTSATLIGANDVTVSGDLTVASKILVSPAVTGPFTHVPLGLWQPCEDAIQEWFFTSAYLWHFADATDHNPILIPMTGTVYPSSAAIDSVKVRYITSGFSSGIMHFDLISISDAAVETIHETTTLAAHASSTYITAVVVSPTIAISKQSVSVYMRIRPDTSSPPNGTWGFAAAAATYTINQYEL